MQPRRAQHDRQTTDIHAPGSPAGIAGVDRQHKAPVVPASLALTGSLADPWSARSVRGERSVVNRQAGRGLAIGRREARLASRRASRFASKRDAVPWLRRAVEEAHLISSLGAGGVLPWCGYADAPARDPLPLRPPLLLPRFTQPEPRLSLRGPWFRKLRPRWRERRERLLGEPGGVWRENLPISGQPENRRRCWRRCGSPAKEARHVRYLDATLNFSFPERGFGVFFRGPGLGIFPDGGWRVQGLVSSRIAAWM
jgi:hypothetical protein